MINVQAIFLGRNILLYTIRNEGWDMMYIRKWIPEKDRMKLIDLTVNTFRVKAGRVNKELKGSYEILVLCDDNDEIAGFLSYRLYLNTIAFVNYIVLDQQHRGKGIVFSFLPQVIENMKKQGVRGIYGLVSKNNPKAMQQFRKWGFQPVRFFPKMILIQLFI